jgi:hypothetical protein
VSIVRFVPAYGEGPLLVPVVFEPRRDVPPGGIMANGLHRPHLGKMEGADSAELAEVLYAAALDFEDDGAGDASEGPGYLALVTDVDLKAVYLGDPTLVREYGPSQWRLLVAEYGETVHATVFHDSYGGVSFALYPTAAAARADFDREAATLDASLEDEDQDDQEADPDDGYDDLGAEDRLRAQLDTAAEVS